MKLKSGDQVRLKKYWSSVRVPNGDWTYYADLTWQPYLVEWVSYSCDYNWIMLEGLYSPLAAEHFELVDTVKVSWAYLTNKRYL